MPRALEVGEKILRQYCDKIFRKAEIKLKAERLIALFRSESDLEEYIDFDHFADLWLSLLVPALDKLKGIQTRRRKIYTLRDLNQKNVKLTEDSLDWLLESCQYSNTLDEMISSCIIGIPASK